MKRLMWSVLLVIGIVLSSGCATTQTWPAQERSAENKMVLIQEKIGDGLKTGALTPDQAQSHLTTLKGIRTDYTALRDKRVYQEEWSAIQRRLDALESEIDKGRSQTSSLEAQNNGNRIVTLQRRIEDGRSSRRLPQAEERDFQARLDSIRRDYLRATDGGRSPTQEESREIARRLDSLEIEMNRFR